MNKKVDFWLLIEPYVYLEIKKEQALLYSTLDGKHLIYYETNKEVIALLRKISKKTNYNIVSISQDKIKESKNIQNFINDIKKNYMGDLIKKNNNSKKPIQLNMRFSRKNRLFEEFSYSDKRENKKNPISYINELTIYINNKNNNISINGHKQFLFPLNKRGKYNELSIKDIEYILQIFKNSPIKKINIIGGKIFKYSYINELVNLLNNTFFFIKYHIHYKDLENKITDSLNFRRQTPLIIYVDPPLNKKSFYSLCQHLDINRPNTIFEFIITNDRDYIEAQKIIKLNSLKNYNFRPFYNGNNLLFFKDNIYINQSLLLAQKLTMENIWKRKTININKFGNITILPNKKIYSDINKKSLGFLGQDSIKQMMIKEISQYKHWFKIREKVKPCSTCIYNSLCPPISNYEYAIGQNNLCDIY